MAVPCQPASREGLDSGRYAPSVHPLTPGEPVLWWVGEAQHDPWVRP